MVTGYTNWESAHALSWSRTGHVEHLGDTLPEPGSPEGIMFPSASSALGENQIQDPLAVR